MPCFQQLPRFVLSGATTYTGRNPTLACWNAALGFDDSVRPGSEKKLVGGDVLNPNPIG